MITQHRTWVYGDHINTDVIYPGKYTYTLTTPEEIASKALEDLDLHFAAEMQPGDVIVAGLNWGCGSSREQAVTALRCSGIAIIIAASFSGLYFRNCINQGIQPVVCPGLSGLITTGDTITIDHTQRIITAADQSFAMPAFSPGVQAILDAGGLVPMLQIRFNEERV